MILISNRILPASGLTADSDLVHPILNLITTSLSLHEVEDNQT